MITKKEMVEVQCGFTGYAFNSYSLEAPIKISSLILFFEYKWIKTYVTKIKVIINTVAKQSCMHKVHVVYLHSRHKGKSNGGRAEVFH